MSKHRFFIPPAEWIPEALALTGDEARHCRDVLRCREGDRIVVFNGAGVEAEARIAAFPGKREARLDPVSITRSDPLPTALVLGQAVPKGKNMDLIVQKATELGVSRIVPLLSERTVVQFNEQEAEKKREKWERVAIEACKQCGQNWLPEILAPMAVGRYLSAAGPVNERELRLMAALFGNARPLKTVLDGLPRSPESATILIGPEGDFTPAELSLAVNAGYQPLSLGPIILRSETAAIYAVSILSYELR